MQELVTRLRDYFVIKGELAKAETCNKILCVMDENLILNSEEVRALIHFFDKVGFISHEFHPEIHEICKKLDEWYKEYELRKK